MRPVREQLEHDRVIRLLQAKYKRKFDVAINPGHEQAAPVLVGQSPWFPDLVLNSTERGRRLVGVVEVETTESVNNLEAMSQWAAFARLRAPFHLYVPSGSMDVAKRLCSDMQIEVDELWGFHASGDQIRFTLVHRTAASPGVAARAESPARPRQVRRPPEARPRTARSTASRPARRAEPTRRTSTKKTGTRTAASRSKPARSTRAQKRK
jgi:hypothetical protein